jgi:peptidoglycan/xylan/chitin deacetylase (PgdA/CDA1 family)
MWYLRLAGFRVLDVDQACACLFRGAPLPRRSVVLTFDDGFQDFHDQAWPVLRRHRYPSTVYLVSGLLGRYAEWQDDFPTKAPLMDASTVLRLQNEGVRFGSHTAQHVRLGRIPEADARAELTGSKAALEQLLGRPVTDLCYPYGDYTDSVRDLATAAGYTTAMTCIRASANHAANPMELPRKAISYGDTLPGFAWKLHFKHTPKHKR